MHWSGSGFGSGSGLVRFFWSVLNNLVYSGRQWNTTTDATQNFAVYMNNNECTPNATMGRVRQGTSVFSCNLL